MTVSRISEGNWECRFYKKAADGSLKSARKRGFPTKTAAQAYELAHRHDSELNERNTFEVMFESLAIANNASEVTTDQRRARLKKYAPSLWSKPMKKITKQDLISWRDDLSKLPMATQTKNDIIGYVKQVGRYAWNAHDIPDNTKVLQSFPKELEDFKDMQIITPAQFSKFLEEEKNMILKYFFLFLFMTGCRKGEARALKKEDYDPVRQSVHIYKAMRRDLDSLKTTKTRTQRWVILDDETNKKIASLCQREGEWMFGDLAPLSNNIIAQHFKENLRKADLPDMRIHDLRHSHVSMLWDAGIPVPEISKRIGHSSPKVTMECYSHIFDDGQNKTKSFLNSLKI